jgi:hypothetical protein
MVVSGLEQVEQLLLAGDLPCPHCQAALRPFGHGRPRIVRGPGSSRLKVTPRRARCGGCRRTQILLPTALTVRRADSTEVIGNALIAKVRGGGVRTIAAALNRPESTVRRWLRGAGEVHAQWLHRQGVDYAAIIDRELLANPPPQDTTLGHALNLLGGAAHRYRERLGLTVPLWSLVGVFAQGRLIMPVRTRHRS